MDNPDQATEDLADFAREEIRWRLGMLGVGLVVAAVVLIGDQLSLSAGWQLTLVLVTTIVGSVLVGARHWNRSATASARQPHPSVPALWSAYLSQSGGDPATPVPSSWHFCDNEHDANECVRLVLAGLKRATTPSRWYFEAHQLPLPAVGDLEIVTNWDGVAQCIIRTTAVDIVRFCDVTAEYARLEGEGDRSLISWRAEHWGYYRRELRGTRFVPQEDMPLVCQRFEVVFP